MSDCVAYDTRDRRNMNKINKKETALEVVTCKRGKI